MGCVCPGRPGVWLGIFDGKSTIILAAGTQIWNPVIAPGEEGAFDWLYEITGVKKGSEMFSGPVDQ
jgi:hypothetical protein